MFMRTVSVLALLASSSLHARSCDLAIASNDQMQFDTATLEVPADCKEVTLTLTHTGTIDAKTMGHNWVLTATPAYRSVAIAGMKAGAENHYVPADDARVIAHTKVVGGGEKTTVTFPTSGLVAGGDYTFFCSFPGHWGAMKGKLVFG